MPRRTDSPASIAAFFILRGAKGLARFLLPGIAGPFPPVTFSPAMILTVGRALSNPARYIGGDVAGLDPMNFHARFEAYLGGRWYLFDPTDQIPPDEIVIIACSRDATHAALTTIFGKVQTTPVRVTTVKALPPGAPQVTA